MATVSASSDHLIFRLDTRHRSSLIVIGRFLLCTFIGLGIGAVLELAHCTKAWNSIDIGTQAENLVADHETVFIVIKGDIYKYNSSDLTLITSTNRATVDSKSSSQTSIQYDSANKALFLLKRSNINDLLTSCWQSKNSSSLLCHLFKVTDLTAAPLLFTNNHNQAFKTEPSETIRVLQDSRDSKNLILTTSRSAHTVQSNPLDTSQNSPTPVRLPAIGRFYMTVAKSSFVFEQKSVLPYKSQLGEHNLFYDYIHIFEYEDHTHFILNDLRKPSNVSSSGEISKTSVRLARICNNDTDLTSYTEISLACNNQNDLHAKVAHLDTTREEAILYVVFEANRKTHLCTYSLRYINDLFSKAIADCNNGLPTSFLLTKIHSESLNQALICNKNPASDWCRSKTNPYIDGLGDQYRANHDSSLSIDDLQSVNFFFTTKQGLDTEEVYFFGTETGFLTKISSSEDLIYTIDLNNGRIRTHEVGKENKITNFNTTNKNNGMHTRYAINQRRIIATNRGKLHSIDIDSCEHYSSCRACVGNRDLLDCVWCSSAGCTKRSECSNPPTIKCPPVIKDFSPRLGPLTGSTRLRIEGEDFGSEKGSLTVRLGDQDCPVNRKESTSETIYCSTKPVDQPRNVTISISVNDDSSHISSNGIAMSTDSFSYVRVGLFGVDPNDDNPASENHQEVKIHGYNLDAGYERNVTIGGSRCTNIIYDQSFLICSLIKPSNVSQELLSQPQPIEILIDGHKPTIELNDNFSMSYLFRQTSEPTQASETLNPTDQTETTIVPMHTVLIFVILIVLSILMVLYLTTLDKFPKFKLPPSFMIKSDDAGPHDNAKVSFRNPSSHTFINSNPSVNASGSLHGLVKLNGSIMSSDYFPTNEHLEQDKPLINNAIDDEVLSLLSQGKILVERNRLTLGHVLGSGQFGRVYKGFLRTEDSGEHVAVAVKTLHSRCTWDDSLDSKAFLEEGLMMRDFDHENVLRLIGVTFDTSGSPMVITPFMLYGDLKSYISDETSSPTVKELIEFGIQVAKGMAYLSNLKFVHRDLAARNCMLDEDLTVKVADFGLSRDIYERDYYSSDNKKVKLPVKWMAIESLERSIYSTKTDVWSYGILLWELMTRGVVPYPDVDNFDLFSYLKEGRRMLRPRYCPVILYNIMLSCWAENPTSRPTFDELVDSVSEIITQLREAKDDDGQQKVSRDETYCDVQR